MKNRFAPEVEVLRFEVMDIITTSVVDDGRDDDSTEIL